MKAIDNVKIEPNSVIVYDIDDTLIDSSGFPMVSIIMSYNYAISKGLIPVIITARQDNYVLQTHKQLNLNGIKDYRAIYFLSSEDYQKCNKFETDTLVSNYKRMARKDIHDKGYVVKISIGDKPWDIGEYGGIGIQLL